MQILRDILEIDESKCNGCARCVNACHERAIEIVDGKAKLVKDILCDGFGDCLPHCPKDAIKITKKLTEVYSKEAVDKNLEMLGIKKESKNSLLSSWPVKLRLVPTTAPFLNNSHLLIASDCTAFAYNSFHNDFMNKRVTLISCPKFDNFDYLEKLSNIIKYNDIKSITVLIMEVPCCSGLSEAVKEAIKLSGKNIHNTVRMISIKGEVLEC